MAALLLFCAGDVAATEFPNVTTNPAIPRHWTLVSDQRSAWYGFAFGAAGDINKDGFRDLVVGVPRYAENGNRTGGFAVFTGERDHLPDAPSELVRGAWRNVRYGDVMCGLVDVNGDGFDDLVVAQPTSIYPDSLDACVSLYIGTADGLKFDLTNKLCTHLPYHPQKISLNTAGDINGDGFQDILMGVNFAGSVSNRPPMFWPVFGSATGLVWNAVAPKPHFGDSFACAGDVNGDGFSDVIVGQAYFDEEKQAWGKALAYYGSQVGLHSAADWSVQGSETYQRLGAEVTGIGDVNGDGFGDVAVSAPGRNPKRGGIGHVLIFLGSRSGLSTSPNWTATAERPSSLFGRSIAGVGDVNGDGCDDFLISAASLTEAHHQEGRVYLYLGATNGPEQSPRLIVDGGLAEAQFGFALANAGDMDGDGLSDFVIGSPYYGISPIQVGRVDLFYGSREAYRKPLHLVAKGEKFEIFTPKPVVVASPSNSKVSIPTDSASPPIREPKRIGLLLPLMASAAVFAGVVIVVFSRQRTLVRRERERIARDLHDEVGAHLTTFVQLGRDGPGGHKAQEISSAALEITRAFEQAVWAVQPDNSTLEQLITFLGVQAPKFFAGTTTRCYLDLPTAVPERSLSEGMRKNLLAVVKEALNNAAKHAQAREVWLRIKIANGRLKIVVEDDGRGLSPTGNANAALASTGLGLANMKQRVCELRGNLTVTNRIGGGTLMVMEIPL